MHPSFICSLDNPSVIIIYYEKTLGMADYVLIMAPAIIAAAVVTALYGRVIDRIGAEKALLPSLLMLALGYVLLFVFPGAVKVTGLAMKIPVFIGSLLMMSGYLTGMAVFGAKIRNISELTKHFPFYFTILSSFTFI